MTSTSTEAKASKASRPGGPFSNGVKPMHAVVLLAVFLIKNVLTAAAASGGGHGDEHGHPEAHSEAHGAGDHHGYQVFHVEFERVQLPFIISLWIFVSSLAKIGERPFSRFAGTGIVLRVRSEML